MPRAVCVVINCHRSPYWECDDTGDLLCERHAPDPSVREWSEMKGEGIEIETMQEYIDEVRGMNDYPAMYDDDEYDEYHDTCGGLY